MNSTLIEYHKCFTYLFCFGFWFFHNKVPRLLHIFQSPLFIMCNLPYYFHTTKHNTTFTPKYTLTTYTPTYSQSYKLHDSTRKKLQNISSNSHYQQHYRLKKRQTITFILVIVLAYTHVTKQVRLTNPYTKISLAHNHHITPPSHIPTNIIQNILHTYNTNNSTISPHTLIQHKYTQHHPNNIQTPPPHTPQPTTHTISHT